MQEQFLEISLVAPTRFGGLSSSRGSVEHGRGLFGKECGLTLPSSGPAYGQPLKSNVRPHLHQLLCPNTRTPRTPWRCWTSCTRLASRTRPFPSFIISRSRRASRATGGTARCFKKKVHTFEHQRTNGCKSVSVSLPTSARRPGSSPSHQPCSSASPRQFWSRFLTTVGRWVSKSSSQSVKTRPPNPVWSNPSIERTFQRPLRALWPAAHVKR